MHWQLAIGAVAAGISAHHGLFIHGEWHRKGSQILCGHFALGILTWWLILCQWTSSIAEQTLLFALVFGSCLLSMFSSIILYRLFFHPLRHFPGPKLAAASKLWHVFRCRDAKNFRVLDDAYRRYGQFVRTGPDEITVFHPGAIEILDAPKHKTLRTDWYDVLHPRTSVVFTRDEAEHTMRRRVWSRAMSTKSIAAYLPRIRAQIGRLATLIEDHKSQPVLVNDVMSWFAFDSMGEFLFGSDFGMMEGSAWHPAISHQQGALALLAPMTDTIWLVRLAFDLLPLVGRVREWNQMVAFCDEAMRKRMQKEVKAVDMASWFIEEFQQAKTSASLKDRRNLLSGNTITAILAGSDTIRASLVCIWYMLAKHPSQADSLYDELRTCDVTDANALATLPQLEAFINETLRLYPPALTGQNRLTPHDGLWINDTWNTGHTKVAAPKYSISRLETAFQDPNSFIPERWTSRPELIIDKRAFAPFGAGHRQCVGKTLALTEIRLLVGMLLNRFRVSFAAGQDVEGFEGDMRDQITAQPGECRVVFTPRVE